MRKRSYVSTLYPLEAFGLKRVMRGEIRVEKFEDRIKPLIPFPHKHDFYQIVVVTGGRGTHEIDFTSHVISRAQIFFMKPDQVHSWTTNQATGYVIEFSSGSKSSTSARAIPDCTKVKDDRRFRAIEKLCELMLEEFDSREPDFQRVIGFYLASLITQCERIFAASKSGLPKSSFFLKFEEVVEQEYRNHRDVEHYAKSLGISAKALTMRVKRLTGRSARDYILDRVALEAKRILADSSVSVAEAGYALGFDDPNYFARFFKQRVKVGPLAFRTKARRR